MDVRTNDAGYLKVADTCADMDDFVEFVLCCLCLCSSDHNRIHRPYSSNEFTMINWSREAVWFSKNTSDKREWKWAFATTTFALPCLQKSWFESDTCRAILTFVCIASVAIVSGLDFGANSSSPYWIYTLHQFGVAFTLLFLVASFVNFFQMRCRYPELGDRIKASDDLTVVAFVSNFAYHLGLPITAAALGQAIEIANTPAMDLNDYGIFLAATILNVSIFFVAAFIVREHVIDWAKFIVYGTIMFLIYVAVVVTHPIPMNSGFLALWYVVEVFAYALNRVITKITMRYKDRTDTPIFVVAPSAQVGP